MNEIEPKARPYRILSLDGGGIRGAFQAVLLSRLAAAVPSLLPSVRLFAGTSIGGINGMLLANGFSGPALEAFYRQHAQRVFAHVGLSVNVEKVFVAGYSQTYLKQTLTDIFGNKTLGDLDRRVLVPSFQLDNQGRPPCWKEKFFHNFPGKDSDANESIVDVALRSSAAPTYFPTYQGYIDGGVGCNNPALAAVSAAMNPQVGNQDLDDIQLLSISCGRNPEFIAGQTHNWGYVEWAGPLVDIMVDANVGIADYHCRQHLSPSSYFRLDPVLPMQVNLAEAKRIDDLMAWADAVDLTPAIAWLRQHYINDAASSGG